MSTENTENDAEDFLITKILSKISYGHNMVHLDLDATKKTNNDDKIQVPFFFIDTQASTAKAISDKVVTINK